MGKFKLAMITKPILKIQFYNVVYNNLLNSTLNNLQLKKVDFYFNTI
jgi:hypothetical protein